MAIKYFSERTKTFYNTPEEATRAEMEAKEKENLAKIQKEREELAAKEKKEKEAAERKAMAEQVEKARKEMIAAQKAYKDALSAFVDKYHTYHFSTSDPNEVPTLFDIFENIFRF